MSIALTETTINGTVYYNVNQLRDNYQAYFYGCIKSPKKIIEKKNIPVDCYLFATENKQGYTVYDKVTDNVPKKAIFFMKKEWVDTHICCGQQSTTSNEENVEQCIALPPCLYLDDENKFKDEMGEVIEIETRGERSPTGIYFLASDVAKGFDIHKLQDIIADKDSSYTRGEDYTYFISKDNCDRTRKVMYLTYEGILRVLILTRSNKTKHFSKWATSVLFTVQMGEKYEKEEVASNMLGINVKSFREALSTCATSVPCVYLFSLGTCSQLRSAMTLPQEIPDDYVVVKYGFTNDLSRRSSEHSTNYGKIQGVKLELLQYTYIDPIYLSDAENDVGNFFKDIEIPITYLSQKELVAVNPSHLKQVIKQYKSINSAYAGRTREMTNEVEKLKHAMSKMEDKYKIQLLEEREKYKDEINKNKQDIMRLQFECEKNEIKYSSLEEKYKLVTSIYDRGSYNVASLEQMLSNVKL